MHPSQLFPIFLLLGSIAVANLTDTKQPHRKVIVLGAGLSGIVAGKTLEDNGIDDFLVLEGQDYIGGRIKQTTMSGVKVEDGANFIHALEAAETAPIWKLKKTTNLKGVQVDTSSTVIRNETGSQVADKSSYLTLLKALSLIGKTQEKRRKEHKKPISAREGLSLLGWKPHTPAQYVLEWFSFDFGHAKKVELIPFSELDGDYLLEGDDFFVSDQRGMIELYKDFYKGFESKIKTNKTVVDIKYNSSFVEVTTKDGELYTADFVLCTFSTGVLASDMVKFTPPLPGWKKEAFLKRPLGAFTKIFLKFPQKFWDDKQYVLHASKNRGYYPIIMNLDMKGEFPGTGVVMMVVTGDEAKRVEKQSFQETKAEIVKVLRGIYGQNISEPIDIYYPRWTLNPYVRGAYSGQMMGYSASKTTENLKKNLGNVYFSGEATSEEWYGYMQGAYLTGEEQAKSIVKAMKCKEDSSNCPSNGATSMKPAIAVVIAAIWHGLFTL